MNLREFSWSIVSKQDSTFSITDKRVSINVPGRSDAELNGSALVTPIDTLKAYKVGVTLPGFVSGFGAIGGFAIVTNDLAIIYGNLQGAGGQISRYTVPSNFQGQPVLSSFQVDSRVAWTSGDLYFRLSESVSGKYVIGLSRDGENFVQAFFEDSAITGQPISFGVFGASRLLAGEARRIQTSVFDLQVF